MMEYDEARIRLQETANEIRLKVEMYFIALAFTLAGLAVQSARFTGDRVHAALEIVAWVCLIASAMVNYLRMERVPTIFQFGADVIEHDKWLDKVRRLPNDMPVPGMNVPKAEAIAKITDAKNRLQQASKKLDTTLERFVRMRTPLFVGGIVLLATSRAYAGLFVACHAQ